MPSGRYFLIMRTMKLEPGTNEEHVA